MSTVVEGWTRGIGALLIALIFISVLMTSSAQQEVVAQLNIVDPKLDYSSAYVIKQKVDQADQDARTAASNEQTANQVVSKASDTLDSAQADFDDAWQSIVPQARLLVRNGKCDLDPKIIDAQDEGTRGQGIAAMQSCPSGASLVGAGSKDGAAALFHIWAVANGQLASAKQRLARAQMVSKALKDDDAKAKQIRDSFDATSKIRSSWYLGGDLLIDFPPALLQIILSFVSGAFGALLLTLVLIVYPKSELTAASGGYGARTLLGGLIALCVYVVLNGGSAVLGNTSSVTAGSNNYMTFCAIGILAGMFSDRVAAWLSARADVFFSNSAK